MAVSRRKIKDYLIEDLPSFKNMAWEWGNSFQYCCILENNSISYPMDPFMNVIAVGGREVFNSSSNNSFEEIKNFLNNHQDWAFGYFSYDLKNEIEELESNNPDFQKARPTLFFIPEHIIFFEEGKIHVHTYGDPDSVFKGILAFQTIDNELADVSDIIPFNTLSKKAYLEKVEQIKEHLVKGDIYEITYCIEFSKENMQIDPMRIFKKLIEKSPMPFSLFLRVEGQYIISASPERFLKLKQNKLISQPIKGTIRRGETEQDDLNLKTQLQTSEKEISENMMIVDLVRNDLAKSSIPGSVKVEEVFKVYSFKQLHQMISTVSSVKRQEVDAIDAIKNAFPMGSMTGAPKIRAMQLIEEYEEARRGLFSGAAGYISPFYEFDLNVLIRSVFYNAETKRLSFQVGSAITFDADAEYEYDECLLKAAAILEVLTGTNAKS